MRMSDVRLSAVLRKKIDKVRGEEKREVFIERLIDEDIARRNKPKKKKKKEKAPEQNTD